MQNLNTPIFLTLLFFGFTSIIHGNNTDTIWVDVRTLQEYESGHLPEALLIPLQSFEQNFQSMVPDSNAVIALYCRSGNRSGIALGIATKLGYKNAFNAGGFLQLNNEK